MMSSSKKLFVNEIIKKAENFLVKSSFKLLFKEEKYTKYKKLYYHLKIGDKEGLLDGRIFNPENKKISFNFLKIGEIYAVEGVYDQYGINIARIKKLEIAEYNKEDYIREIEIDIESLFSEIQNKIEKISNDNLKNLLKLLFDDEQFVETYKNSPSAVKHHHNYLGGNLEHTIGVLRICESIADYHGGLDKDLLITGAIIHDIGKLNAYDYNQDQLISENIKGRLIGHITIGYQIFNDFIKEKIPNFPEDLLLKLNHLLLSNHGKLEWGSPVVPAFPEAIALHMADLTDSQVKKILQSL